MSNNVLSHLVAGTLGVTLALVSPALAFTAVVAACRRDQR